MNKNTIFILFGKDAAENSTLSLVMLNGTNPSNVTFLEKYADPNAPMDPKSSKLSTGANAGIGVGVAVVSSVQQIKSQFRKKKKN